MYADRQAVTKKATRTVFEACPERGMFDVSMTAMLFRIYRATTDTRIASRMKRA